MTAELKPVAGLDVMAVRRQFPILTREVNGKPLVYLDSAASAQKPRFVIDALSGQMETAYANVHRGLRCEISQPGRLQRCFPAGNCWPRHRACPPGRH